VALILDDLGKLGLKGYSETMLRHRGEARFAIHTVWSERIDPALFVEFDAYAVQTLSLVGRAAGDIVERYQAAAVKSSARYLNSFGLRLTQADVDELEQGRVGAYLVGTTPQAFVTALRSGLPPEQALTAARVHLDRIASTDPYRVAGDTIAHVSARSPRFTGRWRRRPGPGACRACHEAAEAGWTRDRDAVVRRTHAGCGCVVEPESAE
jgi:hypothetical protein